MKYDVIRTIRDALAQGSTEKLMEITRTLKEKGATGLFGIQQASQASTDSGEKAEDSRDVKSEMDESVIEHDLIDTPDLSEATRLKRTIDTPAPESEQEQFLSAEYERAGALIEYRLYLPPEAVRNGALLVMLHGCTQDATDFATGTAMNELARNSGYTVLYPSQSAAANPNGCWNWFDPSHQQSGSGEPAIISELTSSICAHHDLNPERVFVAGLSAGGAMALILVEEYPQIFAAVGVHSGLPTGLATNVTEALRAMAGGNTPSPVSPASPYRPTLVIQGDQDKMVNPVNAVHIVERCLDRYRLQHPAEELVYECHDESPHGLSVQRHEHHSPDGVLVCRYWQLDSVAHAWSGGSPLGSYTAQGGLNASQALLDFFDQCSSQAD